jgi:hypothetical protein
LDDPPIHIRPNLPAHAGAKEKNPVGSRHFGTLIIPPTVFTRHQILLTSCSECICKGLIYFRNPPKPDFPISRKRGFKVYGFLPTKFSRFRDLGVSGVQGRLQGAKVRLRRGGSPASGLCRPSEDTRPLCRIMSSGFRDFPLSGFLEILVSSFREKACGQCRCRDVDPPETAQCGPHQLLPENEISRYRV